jgi:subtilase family serine protease
MILQNAKFLIGLFLIVANTWTKTNAQIFSDAPPVRAHIHVLPKTQAEADVPTGYTPDQIRKAYNVNLSKYDGAGQTIAVIEAIGNPNIQNDLNKFNSQFGLPPLTLEIIYPQGKPTFVDETWALETSLDVEWAHAVAPGAKILIVVAKDSSYSDLLPAIDRAVSMKAQQISMSWGSVEWPGELHADSYFDVPFVSFFASSGDGGFGVQYPAASPHVAGVGGTTLKLTSTGGLISEVAWTGSGGGVSAYEPVPSYQSPFQSTSQRTVPDVSYDGDPSTGFPVYDSTPFNGTKGWQQIGGTSAGSPQWAAIGALANSARPASDSNISMLNASLYSIVSSSSELHAIRDITRGCDAADKCAHKGYDLLTGLGSPLSKPLSFDLLSYK